MLKKSSVLHIILRCPLLLGMLFFFLIFGGCQSTRHHFPAQVLRLNIPTDPMTLDPRKGGDVISGMFNFLLFDGLVRLDDHCRPALSLAEKMEVSTDGMTYTFYLKETRWSNGASLTAWDFEKSWKDILHPDFPAMNAYLLYPIKNGEKAKRGEISLSEVGIASLGPRKLQITLEHPTPYFLELLAFCSFFPINVEVDHKEPNWEFELEQAFVCNGPFKIQEWKKGNLLILVKNPLYHRSDAVVIEEIRFNVMSSETTSLQMFEKGDIDILGQPLVPLPADAIPALLKEGDLKVQQIPASTFCSFNIDTIPFNNKNIRKALSYAIDRKQITENITQLGELPALELVPVVLKREKGGTFFQDGNEQEARRLFALGLSELKMTKEELPKVKYTYANSDAHGRVAEMIQQQWRRVLGFEIELEKVDRKILVQLLKSKNYQIGQTFFMAQYNDPMNILERFKTKQNVKNYTGWENQKYTELLESSSSARDIQERFALMGEAEAIFLSEMPIAPIFHWNSAYITQPYVKHFGTAPIGNGFFDRVYIDVEEKERFLTK